MDEQKQSPFTTHGESPAMSDWIQLAFVQPRCDWMRDAAATGSKERRPANRSMAVGERRLVMAARLGSAARSTAAIVRYERRNVG